jgi:hypothetical protein
MRNVFVMVVLAAMLLVLGHVIPGGAQAQEPSSGKVDNEIILSGTSPFEDLTEYAISGDTSGIKRALQAFNMRAEKIENALPETTRYELKALVDDIKDADRRGDLNAIALKSPEAYRVLIEALDPEALKVPVEVSLLDYVGFRFLAVLHAKPGDFTDLEEAAKYAERNWQAIRSRVTDTGLRDAVDVSVAGLLKACTERDAGMAHFAAEVDLAQVDLLEAYFERSGTQ